MSKIWMGIASVIPSEQVPPRAFFLKEMLEPWIIWTIRAGIILIVLAMIAGYIVMKRKTKNGE